MHESPAPVQHKGLLILLLLFVLYVLLRVW
jgi:hypothetical protein